jgi:hypothetical protein
MIMKVQFDSLKYAGSELEKAVKAVCQDAQVTFHNSREKAEAKPKVKVTA